MIALLLAVASLAQTGYKADLYVDGGAYLSGYSLTSVAKELGWSREACLTNYNNSTIFGGSTSDTNGVLLYPDGTPRYRVVFVNGGSASDHGLALGAKGRRAFKQFFDMGGSYVGSCAGAGLAMDSRYFYLGLWHGRMRASNGATGYQTITFDPLDPFVLYGSPLRVPNIRHISGPGFSESYTHAPETEFYGTITSGIDRGRPFLICYEREETGRMIISPSHPEYASSGPTRALFRAMLKYAWDGAKGGPTVQGVIETGDVVTRVIGDGQVHRWLVLDDVDVQLELPDERIVVTRDADGLSVRGNHSVLNGVSYTLISIDATE